MVFINILFLDKYNLHKNIILKIILFFFMINRMVPKIIRPDNDPLSVSDEVLKRIHSFFNIKEVIYKEKLFDYTINMKFLNIRIFDEGIYPETYGYREFFSIELPLIEFILNINISNNNDYVNSPINKSDIVFNNIFITPNLDFQLKYMNANISAAFLEFVRKEDGTYQYVFFYDDLDYSKYIEIYFDIDRYKYFPKIYKFLNDNKKKVEDFIYNSFCKYLEDILSGYPQSDASYLYDKLVDHIRTVQTFALNITTNTKLEKVIINYFKEENAIMDSAYYITNITIDMDLIFDGEAKIEKYKGIIREMYLTTTFIAFGEDDFEIANTTVNTIIKEVINTIIGYYLAD